LLVLCVDPTAPAALYYFSYRYIHFRAKQDGYEAI